MQRVYPPSCQVCGAAASAQNVCADCAAELPWLRHACQLCAIPVAEGVEICGACQQRPPPYNSVAGFQYGFPVDALISRFKFRRDLVAGQLLGELLADRITPSQVAGIRALIPIPLSYRRQVQRGFNQSALLAQTLSKRLQLPMLDALVRCRHTSAQSGLDRKQRQRNVAGAFALRSGVHLPPHVALVDDVMTTGATLRAAATALKTTGVDKVTTLVVARAQGPRA